MIMETAIVLGVLGLIGTIAATFISNDAQQTANLQMAELNKKNQKELMDYQNQIAQSTNTIATQKGHAAAAGFSPALLYGNMSTPGLADSYSASNTGESPNLKPLDLFGRMPLSNIAEFSIQKAQSDAMIEKAKSDAALNHQKVLESVADTAEKMRYTAFQRRLEQTVVDQSLATLAETQARRENLEFQTFRGNQMLPLELEQAGMLTAESASKVMKNISDIQHNTVDMTRLRKEVSYLGQLEEQSEAQTKQAIEQTKHGAIARVMSEFGLNNLKLPPSMRTTHYVPFYRQHKEQIDGALATLISLGFSPQEASKAVIYYVADPSDRTTGSAINGLSRIASAFVKKGN